MPYSDPEKRKEANRRWYERHREEQINRSKVSTSKLRLEVRAYKESKSCVDCGVAYPYYVMDFDHVRGEKTANVADILNRSCSRPVLFAEIAKCDLVCSNCHRVRTHNRRSKNKDDVQA
jgi:hypothetical protein